MDKLFDKLPAFALPFVTRALRGPRAKRYLVFSAVLSGLTLIIGLWLAVGSGQFEREMRSSLDLEVPTSTRESQEFMTFADELWEIDEYKYNRARLDERGLSVFTTPDQYVMVAVGGLTAAAKAVQQPASTPEQRALQDEARAVVTRLAPELFERVPGAYVPAGRDYQGSEAYYDEYEAFFQTYGYYSGSISSFSWDSPEDIQRLEQIVARDGVPAIERYTSPLGLRHALGIAGMLAGLIAISIGTVFAPILVAVQQAQERHENTLMPLTATAFTPRELALGLAAGPMAVAAIFIVPQLALYGLGAVLMGHVIPALGFLATLAAASLLLVFGAQLAGDLVGTRRTPGIVGIALMVAAVGTWSFGGTMAMESLNSYGDDIQGLAALLPHIGIASLFHATWHTGMSELMVLTTIANAVGCLIISRLVLAALAKRVAGRSSPLLSPVQGAVGALTCLTLASLAIPMIAEYEVRLYGTLAVVALPFIILLMGRVPMSDGAPKMRSVPVAKLLAELGAWTAVPFVIIPIAAASIEPYHPLSVMWLAWAVGVTGLIAIHLASVPRKIAANLWLGLCAMAVILAFVQGALWGIGEFDEAAEVFVLWELSPVLGLLEAALAVIIPLSLVRQLRANLKSIR